MSVELFRDDDRAYTAWLTENVRGYVLNIQRSMNPSDARVHEVACRTITGTPPRGRTWTGPYVKACSASLTQLDAWALSHAKSAGSRFPNSFGCTRSTQFWHSECADLTTKA